MYVFFRSYLYLFLFCVSLGRMNERKKQIWWWMEAQLGKINFGPLLFPLSFFHQKYPLLTDAWWRFFCCWEESRSDEHRITNASKWNIVLVDEWNTFFSLTRSFALLLLDHSRSVISHSKQQGISSLSLYHFCISAALFIVKYRRETPPK